MELPTYAVSQSLLSSRSVAPSRGDQTLRAPTNGIEGQDRRNQVTGKRKRTNPRSASNESSSRCNGLPQYAVPASFQSPQKVQHSIPGQALQTPPSNEIDDPDRHEHPATISQHGLNVPVNSRSESGYLTLGTPCEAQTHPSHAIPATVRQTQEQLHAARTPSSQFLNDVPNFVYQSTDKDAAMKHNYFLDPTFFPSPTITDAWGELPTPDLSWDTATKPPTPVNKATSTAETDASLFEAAPERGEVVSDRSAQDAHSTANTGESQLDTSRSIEARLSQVLKAVDAAGFDSLDSAVIAYYKKSSKGNEWLRQEQRLNRMRRLPVLLKELHLSAQGWGQWERRNFQEQIIKSTEDILFAELEDHLATRKPSPHSSPCSSEQQQGQARQHMTEDDTDVEAELPNTWTLLTSLSTKYSSIASQDLQTDMPRLVGKFLAAGTELGT